MADKTREGWAYGTTDGGEWLTILGSAYATPTLYATEAEARATAPTDPPSWIAERQAVAYVREQWHPGVTGNGRAYRILRRSEEAQS